MVALVSQAGDCPTCSDGEILLGNDEYCYRRGNICLQTKNRCHLERGSLIPCAAQQGELHSDRKNQPLNGCSTGILPQPVGTVLLEIPEPQESDSDSGINVIALPALSQVR